MTGNAQLTATITGTVSDSTGAVLPGTSVVALNEDTGISRTVESDAAGRLDSDAGRITDTNTTVRQLQFGLKLIF